MRKILIGLLFASSVAFAADCSNHTIYGPPVSPTDAITLCRTEYMVSYSQHNKVAYWSAEHLTVDKATNHSVRKNAFKVDPDVDPSIVAKPSDYDKSGYDKGHLSPFDDMGSNVAAGLESFYMTNMVPQHPDNNRNGWKSLEILVRKWAVQRSDLFVITGGVYTASIHDPIGKSKVLVPNKLFKIVLDPHNKVIAAFLVPNVPITKNDLPKFLVELADIEKETGIKFFPKLPHGYQLTVKLWN